MRSLMLLAAIALTSCELPIANENGQQDSGSEHPSKAASPAIVFEPGPVATTTIDFPRFPKEPPSFRFHVVGTEPFWSAKLSSEKLVYSTPENIKGQTIEVQWSSFDEHGVQQWRGSLDGKALELKIKLGTCSDGMSDNVFEYVAELRIDEDVRKGCAKRE